MSATCVHPGGIRTNIARAARMDPSVASATGRSADASSRGLEKSFITSPARAAEVIVGAVRRNKRRVLVGPDARVFDAMARVAPAGYQRLITGVVRSRSAT